MYVTLDAATEIFGVGKATVSRSIVPIAPVVRQCTPIPARIHDRARRVSTLDEPEEILPGLRCLIDTSEPQVRGPSGRAWKSTTVRTRQESAPSRFSIP